MQPGITGHGSNGRHIRIAAIGRDLVQKMIRKLLYVFADLNVNSDAIEQAFTVMTPEDYGHTWGGNLTLG